MSTPQDITAWQRLVLRWKMLRLPWRRRVFTGTDMLGNLYWEVYNPASPRRPRRIVDTREKTLMAGMDLHPEWIAWLRYRRYDAPTLEELHADLRRQQLLQVNAKALDAKWSRERERLQEMPKPEAEQPPPSHTDPFESERQVESWQPRASGRK